MGNKGGRKPVGDKPIRSVEDRTRPVEMPRTGRKRKQMKACIKITTEKKQQIAERLGRDEPMAVIARAIGVSTYTVWRHAVMLREEWRLARIEAIERQRSRELEKLEMLEEEAMQAWEKSQEEEVRTEVTTADKENGKTTKEVRIGKSGDPRFLAQIERCIKGRREMLGLDLPVKTETYVEHRGSVLFGQLTPEQMKEEILSRLDKSEQSGDTVIDAPVLPTAAESALNQEPENA